MEDVDSSIDPNNLITPIRNINAFVSENIAPAQAHDASTTLILQNFDNLAKMMQTLISQRKADRKIYATQEQVANVATTYDQLKPEQDIWLKEQNKKIDDRLDKAEGIAKKMFEDGIASLSTTAINKVAEISATKIQDAKTILSKYAATNLEHEENMRLGKLLAKRPLQRSKSRGEV